jgi:hypothetical protein
MRAFADLAPTFNPSGEAERIDSSLHAHLLGSERDSHPSDAGYPAIAGVLFETSGYARLGD